MTVELDELLAIGDGVVARARPGEQLEAVVVASHDTEVRAWDGAIESLSSAETRGVGIRVIHEGRQGIAYAGTLDADAVLDALAEARDNAEFGTVDEHAGLAEPDGVAVPELELHRPEVLATPTDVKVGLALELERAVRAADPRIAGVESAEYVDAEFCGAIVSTAGVRNAGRETACYLAAYALAEDDRTTQTGFGYSIGRAPGELDPARAAADAADRATRLLGARQPESGRSTVVLDPWVTAQLLGLLGYALSAESVQKGRSFLADRMGEAVASPLLTLVDDPTDVRAFTATEVDGEGLACRRNVLVDGGVLTGFAHNATTARRAGTTSNGCAVRGSYKTAPGAGTQAVSLVPGIGTQAELVAAVGDGILVQDVAGLHSGVNPVSGDFSTGAEGLRIRGGELAEPVREFTIASTLQRMLLDVRAVGADLEWLPMSAAGVSLVLGDVTVSGS